MHILHIVHQFFPDHVGGVEHYTRSLALAQRQIGHQVTIFCRQSGMGQRLEQETREGLPVYRAIHGPFTPAKRFRAALGDRFLAESLQYVVRQAQPHLIHIQHLMGLPVTAVRAAASNLPLIVTLHDYWWICANAQLLTDDAGQVCDGPRWWLNCARCGLARAGASVARPLSPLVAPIFAGRAALIRRLMAHVDAWVAPTAFVADWHVAHGFPAGRMYIVGHGIEMPPPDILAQASQRNGDQEAIHVVYVGGLSPQKGVHLLVDAFNPLPPSARLTIAGDETAFPAYCADLHHRAQHSGIHFVGQLNRGEVWRTLAQADVLVVPSLWYETASLVIQEAFAVRTPVIAADHGALSERVRHGVDGILVPPGDVTALHQTLLRLAQDPDLLPRLRANIPAPMDMAEHVQQLEAIYQAL